MNNLNYLSTSEFLIPSSTGEYLPKNITIVYDVNDLEDSNPELADELSDNGIQLIYSINIKEAPQAFEELLKQLLDILQSDFIGDDDFFDNLPDLINQIRHIAFLYNYNNKYDRRPIEYPEALIEHYDQKKGIDPKTGSLADQCDFSDNHLFEEQETIQRILKEFPKDQQ
jgi:hypothetical protein|nr:MAG TPA: hypothetical protein [Caudoviricetes sp.]